MYTHMNTDTHGDTRGDTQGQTETDRDMVKSKSHSSGEAGPNTRDLILYLIKRGISEPHFNTPSICQFFPFKQVKHFPFISAMSILANFSQNITRVPKSAGFQSLEAHSQFSSLSQVCVDQG